MQDRLNESRAVQLWSEVVGMHIASQCRRPFVKGGVMTVPVPNAALRQELAMNRSRLAGAINTRIGRETISEIRFIS